MKTITTLQNGQIQTAEVTEQEFKNLEFKNYDKAPDLKTFLADVDYIKVYFNKKGQVVTYKVIEKESNVSTRLFKKEALTKKGRLKASALKILNEVAK